MNVRSLMVGFGMLAFAASPMATDRLALRVSPSVAFAPANLVVRTTVELNKDNRSIEIIAESDDFYRSSELQLDGDRAPRTTMFHFGNLPGGTYVVRAVLKGAGGHAIASSEVSLNVLEGASRY